jgi:hypothetical protein
MARILNGLIAKQIDQMRQCSHRAVDAVVADWSSWVAEAMAS